MNDQIAPISPFRVVNCPKFYLWSLITCFGTSLFLLIFSWFGPVDQNSQMAHALSVGSEFRSASAILNNDALNLSDQQFVQSAFLKLAIVPPILMLAFIAMVVAKIDQLPINPKLSLPWFLAAVGVSCLFVLFFYIFPLRGFADGTIYHRRGVNYPSPLGNRHAAIFIYDVVTLLGLLSLSILVLPMAIWVKKAIWLLRTGKWKGPH